MLIRIHHSKYVPRYKFLAVEAAGLIDLLVTLATLGTFTTGFRIAVSKKYFFVRLMQENAKKYGIKT